MQSSTYCDLGAYVDEYKYGHASIISSDKWIAWLIGKYAAVSICLSSILDDWT
jgi:hypothetical protein